MIVTINTDASFNFKHQIGSYAFWITSDMGRVQQSGLLRKKVSRAEIAEFRCIINAVHVLGLQNWKNIKKIIINTDCLNVIHLLKKDKINIKKYALASWGTYLTIIFFTALRNHKLIKIPIEYRHVESHVDITDKRTYVNDWCDKAAKEVIRKQIHKLENPKP